MSLINFSGIASGIDTEGLIKATSDATRAARVTPLQTKITDLTSTNDALTELKSRLGKLSTAISKFKSLNGGGLVKQGTSTDESILGATAANSATNGTYAITVNSKAKNGVTTFADTTGDLSAVVDATLTAATYPTASDRYLTVTVGTGSEQEVTNITLDETSTFSSIIANFNQNSTKAVMSAVNTGTSASPSYQLVVSALNEGTLKGQIAVSRGSAIATTLHFDPGTITSQAASNANIDIAGIGSGISRSSNTISDVIPGVTLNILKNSGAVTVSIGDDVSTTESKITDIVTAWNNVVSYLAEQNLITTQDDGKTKTNTFAPLSKTRVDEGALSAIRSVLSTTKQSLGTTAEGLEQNLVMSAIGITSNRDGTLAFNPSTTTGVNFQSFESALATNAYAVNELLKQFADTLSSTAGTIDQYIGFNRLIDLTITGNRNQINDLNKRIGEAEKSITANEAALRARYSRLEGQIGQLQSQQQQLASVLR